MKKIVILLILLVIISSCKGRKKIRVSTDNISPGSSVMVRGVKHKLYPGSIKPGENFITRMKKIPFDFKFGKKVTIISIFPSIDTAVCEEQTHILGETDLMKADIDLVGGDGHADAGAAYEYPPFDVPGSDGLRDLLAEIRIIHALEGIRAEIDAFVAHFIKHFNKFRLELHARVVAADSYFHSLRSHVERLVQYCKFSPLRKSR